MKSPTAGSVGVIPGAFLALSEGHGISDKEMADALLVSAGISNIIFSRATFAAAVAGCGAEVGVATCMAASGLAWLVSKKAEYVESAASIAMQNYLGLECSSVAGAVEVPCAYRCALGAVSALTSASMACAGMIFQVPLDEVIDVMYEVGQALPNGFRETQGAGLAKTPLAFA
jgi:L-serine dehydratase